MSCGVGCGHGSDSALLRLWRRLVAMALIGPLAWDSPYAVGAALEKAKRQKQTNKNPHIPNKEYLEKFYNSVVRRTSNLKNRPKQEASFMADGIVKWNNYFGKQEWQFLKMLNTHVPHDTAIPIIGISQEK